MKYLNDNYVSAINNNSAYKAAIIKIKSEVDDFYSSFNDDPSIISEWGHYYFCNYDGGRLIYDRKNPKSHKCEICGKDYTDEVYDGVWTYFYRNEAILTAWKAAALYAYDKNPNYLDILMEIIGFYAKNYTKFVIHNKERDRFLNIDDMKWGCGRIMPQGLNESIITIRMIQALEIVKSDLPKSFLDEIYHSMFREIFKLLKPQVNQIHNIRCWNNSAIAVMGFFFNDKEMIDFVFNGEYNIIRQIKEGVTKDGFWYEGSIHYNFFTLEGITPTLLFASIYNYDFDPEAKAIVRNMFVSAYNYAFTNLYLPNPNDGWPSINLKTYSYIYSVAAKVFSSDKEIVNILKIILNNKYPRTTLPLSKPYYINNEIAFEQLLLNTDMDIHNYSIIPQKTLNFSMSSFGMIRNENMNVFVKYGLNGPSHAHPDIINIEVMYKDGMISRDISNAGYISLLCNEWHRRSLAHNTVIMNGLDITSRSTGKTLKYSKEHIICEALNVYDGVDEIREIKLLKNGFSDIVQIKSANDGVFDYVFHLENDINLAISNDFISSSLGFKENGYQYVKDVMKYNKKTDVLTLEAKRSNQNIAIDLDLKDHELYVAKTMDNPVNKERTTIIIRGNGKNICYKMSLRIGE
ncbi:MAG: heparinase II/III family protein [Acholeplasmatales bacterium]|nr:heparinase II/III family protein [Acholeplasmatales bacterium]